MRDITERKQAEAKLKTLTDELQRSNRELKDFAYVASHDLQSPLLSVSSSLKLLKRRIKDRLDKESDEYINYAQDSISNMVTLIRNLLKYSRVKTKSEKFKPADCETVLEQTFASLKADIEDSEAVITYDHLPEIIGDPILLARLFQNLISNAIKFRGKESPRVHISAEQRGNKWVFSVRDNGLGIEPEHIKRIFGIFERLHEEGVQAGTGIGLSTCRKIVELHGGRIWVESELGKGSTFYFTIPFIELSDSEKKPRPLKNMVRDATDINKG